MKREALLKHLRKYGCYLKREGRSHSLWMNLGKPRFIRTQEPRRPSRAMSKSPIVSPARYAAIYLSPRSVDRVSTAQSPAGASGELRPVPGGAEAPQPPGCMRVALSFEKTGPVIHYSTAIVSAAWSGTPPVRGEIRTFFPSSPGRNFRSPRSKPRAF